jgi:hypothetical protein
MGGKFIVLVIALPRMVIVLVISLPLSSRLFMLSVPRLWPIIVSTAVTGPGAGPGLGVVGVVVAVHGDYKAYPVIRLPWADISLKLFDLVNCFSLPWTGRA